MMPEVFRSAPIRADEMPRDIRAEKQKLAADYQMTFRGDAGQRVLADLLRKSGVLLSTYRMGKEGMELREGQRMIGLYIITQLNETPDSLMRFAVSGKTEDIFS